MDSTVSQVEFVVQAGYAFTISIRDPYDAYDSLASGLSVTEVVPGVYRCATSSLTGVVYVEAVAGALKVVGYANLDQPGDNDYSEVLDTLAEAEAMGAATSNGGGVYTVTVTVASSAGGVAPNSIVTIKNAAGSTVITWATANSSGQCVFQLNPATYQVAIQPAGSQFAPLAVQTLVVNSAASVTYTLTAQTIDPPGAPGIATVRFLVLDGSTPVSGVKVSAELEDANSMVDTAMLLRVKHSGVTDSSGICDLVMVQKASFTRGGIYKIAIADSTGRRSHERRVTVPSSASLYAEDLPDA